MKIPINFFFTSANSHALKSWDINFENWATAVAFQVYNNKNKKKS